jgi:predicted HicB family RNase H-like nuclease
MASPPRWQALHHQHLRRLPKSLHAALANEAEIEGVSLNQLVVSKLALHLQLR